MQGQIEVMLLRRLLYDDSRGVEEVLNEIDENGKGLMLEFQHYLVFNDKSNNK